MNRPLDVHDVMIVITKTAFKYYLSTEHYHVDMLASGANIIPSFEMARVGVFHVESARPSILVSDEGIQYKERCSIGCESKQWELKELFVCRFVDRQGALRYTSSQRVL